ncbi:MAG TPA: hypothetical protein VFZ09_25005 [Archangium sp.]|uniref:hypothetical protein n=1 Tax=Archangium sp. TaxID=1872627 RepID=UPI002E3523B1|nr:hypothetical protein [Archangium sp.]HEX5749512.1 hypothetical protein [Archangium sp.]
MSTLDTSAPGARLVVQGIGMVCPVGLDVAAASAAVRARMPRFNTLPFHDQRNQPITGASVPEIVRTHQGYRRMVPLLVRAIGECITRRERAGEAVPRSVTLLLAIGGPARPDHPLDMEERLMRELQERLGFPLSRSSRVFAQGPSGCLRALEHAVQLLARRECDGCIVAAADSLVGSRALSWLEQQDRLKTETNSDGVIPSEAAAALWVARPGHSLHSLLDIQGLGFAEEPSAKQEDAPKLAEGLAQAIRHALVDARRTLRDVDFRVGSVTGEREAFMEASTAFARLMREPRPTFPLWLPAEILGDVGAALPACMLCITAFSMAHGYAPGRTALLFVSSPGPERTACVVATPQKGA